MKWLNTQEYNYENAKYILKHSYKTAKYTNIQLWNYKIHKNTEVKLLNTPKYRCETAEYTKIQLGNCSIGKNTVAKIDSTQIYRC